MHFGFQHSFGSEDENRLVLTCFWHSFWGGEQGSQWLMHYDYQYSLGSENNKRWRPSWRHLFWTEDYQWLVPPDCWGRSGGLCRRNSLE